MVFYFKDLRLTTHPEVYEPGEDSILLATNVKAGIDERVLDVGTGTGIQAIVASRTAKKVLAVDINPRAVETARLNAKKNNAENIEFVLSDLFAGIKKEEKFDLMIFNPPYLPAEEKDLLGRSWSGGKHGRQLIDRFIEEAPKHLKKGGRVLLLVSSLNDPGAVLDLFGRKKFDAKILDRKKLWFEELLVIEAVK